MRLPISQYLAATRRVRGWSLVWLTECEEAAQLFHGFSYELCCLRLCAILPLLVFFKRPAPVQDAIVLLGRRMVVSRIVEVHRCLLLAGVHICRRNTNLFIVEVVHCDKRYNRIPYSIFLSTILEIYSPQSAVSAIIKIWSYFLTLSYQIFFGILKSDQALYT